MPSSKSTIDTYLEFHHEGDGLKKAAKGVSKFEEAGKKAGGGLSAFNVSLGNLASNGIQSVISGAGQAAGALFDFGAQAAEIASDARETESLLNSALGPAYDGFAEKVDAVGAATGRSTREFKQAVAPILAMTKAQGFAAEQAGAMSVQFGSAALDLNSYFNSTTGFEDLQSALAGSADTLQKYGINANVAALRQEALNLGLIEGKEELDQQTRSTALLALVQRQASDAMGDATRTAGDYANVQRALTDQFADFKAEVGSALIDAIAPAQKELLALGKDVLPVVAKWISEGVVAVTEFATGFAEIAAGAQQFAKENQFLVDSLSSVADQLNFLDLTPLEILLAPVGGGPLLEMISNIREAGAETLALTQATENLNNERSTGSSGRGGRGSFQTEPEPNISYANTDPFENLTTDSGFGNFTDGFIDEGVNVELGGFFTLVQENTQSTVDNFNQIRESISQTRSQIEGLSSADIVSALGDAENNAFDSFAEGLAGKGVSIQDQATALSAAGLGLEEVNVRIKDALEQGATDVALAYVDAGKPIEDALALLDDFQAQIDSAENPLDLAMNDTLGLQDALAELGSSTFAPKVTFEVDSTQIDEALSKLESLTGVESPVKAALASNSFVSNDIAGNRGRVQ